MRGLLGTGAMLGLGLLAGCGGVPGPTATPADPTPPVPSLMTLAPRPTLPPVACDGFVTWTGLPAAVANYGGAWNGGDDEQFREGRLVVALAEDASFVDPTMEKRVVGREGLGAHIAAAHERNADTYYEPREWIPSDAHHGYAQLRWRLCARDGDPLLLGDDFLELDADGRITRATRFFATEGTEPARPVCHLPLGDWTGVPDIARKWAATTVSEPATRAALVAEIFAESGSYVDPSDDVPVLGHHAIVERVAGMLWAGAFFEAAAWTEGDDHHDYMRLRWRLCDREAPGLEGVDYVEIGEDGRLARVVGFFPWP